MIEAGLLPLTQAPAQPIPVRECLLVVLNEGWEHRRYAERDLAALEQRGTRIDQGRFVFASS